MSNQNRIKVKIKKTKDRRVRAELTLERRNTWGLYERRTFTVPLVTLERALRDATIEAPWAEMLKR